MTPNTRPRLYRPSNGMEGDHFEAKFCDRCQRDEAFNRTDGAEDGCTIHAAALGFNVNEEGYPQEWRYTDDGEPVCTAFRAIGEEVVEPPFVDPAQLDLLEAR